MKLHDIKVSVKLLVTNLFVVASMCASAAWLEHSVSSTLTDTNNQVEKLANNVRMGKEWKGLTDANLHRAFAASFSTVPEVRDTMLQRYKQHSDEITALHAQLKKAANLSGDAEALAKIATMRERIHVTLDKLAELKKAGDIQAIEHYVQDTMQPTLAAYLGSQDEFVSLQEVHRKQAEAAAFKAQSVSEWTGYGVMLFVALVSLGWILLVVRSIVGPLQRAVDVADTIAAGDLTQNLLAGERKDEIGKLMTSLAAMGQRLREVVAEVRQGVDSVGTASTEIAAGNADLSTRTEQAAASLEEAAASMDELTGTVAHSAESAAQASVLVGAAAVAATRGHEVVSDVIVRMKEISESSQRISDIISVIDGIAFQTNILALNAAVEAARAGEQGRGFAVVASEVRVLATRSADAAKQIKVLIATSAEKVEAGSALVVQTGHAMSEIESSVKRASDMMSEISAATKEQRDGIAQVNQSVTQLDEMTQQNASLVEESLAAATALRDQAANLASLVSMFKVDDQPVKQVAGAAATATRQAAAPAKRAPAPALRISARSVPAAAHIASQSRNEEWVEF